MPRPCCLRHVGHAPCAAYFKPAGIPVGELKEVVLGLDELEAMRLADLDGLYQEKAAEQMKISRPTFSRVIEQARRKVADALIHGKALRMEGGSVVMRGARPMPGKDGTGPTGKGQGTGRAPCGCAQRNGAAGHSGTEIGPHSHGGHGCRCAGTRPPKGKNCKTIERSRPS
jgi:uncharacterized protein